MCMIILENETGGAVQVNKWDTRISVAIMFDGVHAETWLPFSEAERLRDWLNKTFPKMEKS